MSTSAGKHSYPSALTDTILFNDLCQCTLL